MEIMGREFISIHFHSPEKSSYSRPLTYKSRKMIAFPVSPMNDRGKRRHEGVERQGWM
jgi:hypothetical protein